METKRAKTEYNIIKNLHQYKNFSEEQLRTLAKIRAIEYHACMNDAFSNEVEKKAGKVLLRKYLYDFIPESVSDLNTLKDIVFLEVINIRFQSKFNSIKSVDNTSLKLLDMLHRNQERILLLKKSLYITRDTRKKENAVGFSQVDMMRKQFEVWCENNQASRTKICPACGQMILLRIKPDVWEMQKHPFFKDRILGNKKLIELYFKGTLTEEDIREILDCGDGYLTWLIRKWGMRKQLVREDK